LAATVGLAGKIKDDWRAGWAGLATSVRLRRLLWRLVATVVLAAMAIVVVDWLTAQVFDGAYYSYAGWWGPRQDTPWGDAVAAKSGLLLESRDLRITINGDELSAQYTVTARSDSRLVAVAAADDDRGSGNDLVNNALGGVQVSEFQYGFTGSHHTAYSLTFSQPELTMKAGIATVTVSSAPFRLYLQQQYLEVDRPSGVRVGGRDQVRVDMPGVQVSDLSGATSTGITGTEATLRATGATVSAAIRTGGAGLAWMSSLRSVGRITIPIADAFLTRLGSALLFYGVMLWALTRARAMTSSPVAECARRVVLAVTAALAAVAFLGLAVDISSALISDLSLPDYISAGPLGLMVAATAVAWPAACVRAGNRERPTATPVALHGRVRTWALRATCAACHVLLAGIYGFALDRLGFAGPFTDVRLVAGALCAAALTWMIARLLIGGRVAACLVSCGMLAFALTATIGWPVLWYGTVTWQGYRYPEVSTWGKLTFVALAVVTVSALSIMLVRAVWTVLGPNAKAWRWGAALTVALGIGLAALPDAITESGIASPHADGLNPIALFNLFDSLPWVLDWVLTPLLLVVALRLPMSPDSRRAARILAIPIALELLYWPQSWLYLPVELLLGFLLVSWLLLPQELASVTGPDVSASALRRAIARWQNAEFVAALRQTLVTSGMDDVRERLLNKDKDNEAYTTALSALAKGQEELAEHRDSYQREALEAKAEAFGRWGAPLDPEGARSGLITGAVLGTIPAVLTLVTSQPPDTGSTYPVLNFFGGTAWSIFVWPLTGAFIGYFLPLIRGANGVGKALWIYMVALVPQLPVNLIWNDGHDWENYLISTLELLVFLVVVTVIVDDLRVLRATGMRLTDWARVHNWRFVVTWSTALIAAIGTAAATFLSTAATDFGHQTVTVITKQANPPASNKGP
jgi:hypothetical protein